MNVMKKLIFYNIIMVRMLFSSITWSQNLEKDLIPWLEKHTKQEIKNQLNLIKNKYPNSPVPLFLEAYTEENGDRAVEIYKQMIDRYPNSKFTDDALLKIGQYYYAVGSYVIARQYLDNLTDQFPDSPLIPEAKYLAARCLIASGHFSSAEQELKAIIKNYSKTPFKKHAQAELDVLDNMKRRENSPAPFDGPMLNQDHTGGYIGNSKKFTIQIGAYSDKSNAQRQKEYYSNIGYQTTVESKRLNNNLLYLVWVGEFESEEQAAQFGEAFKNSHGVSYHVVRK